MAEHIPRGTIDHVTDRVWTGSRWVKREALVAEHLSDLSKDLGAMRAVADEEHKRTGSTLLGVWQGRLARHVQAIAGALDADDDCDGRVAPSRPYPDDHDELAAAVDWFPDSPPPHVEVRPEPFSPPGNVYFLDARYVPTSFGATDFTLS